LTNDALFFTSTPFLQQKDPIIIMVLMINGVPLEEAPRDVTAFLRQHPNFKESSAILTSIKPESIGPHGLIYVFAREFAVTHPHDNKVSVLGTDDITTSHIVVIRHTGSGAVGLSQIDRSFTDDSFTTMIQRIQSLSYHYEGRLQVHVIGGFADSRRISHALSISLLRKLRYLTLLDATRLADTDRNN
jgi:protein N-terminal asparagine amidohydrolase